MYRSGHYGAALLAYAPLGFVLAAGGMETVAVFAGAVTVGLTPLPDYDHRAPLVEHRGVTHTVGFALLVGALVGGIGLVVGQQAGTASAAGLAVLGFLCGTLAILAHLAADVVTPAGIQPFWPFTSRHYSLGWVTAANPVANYALLVVGGAAALGGLALGIRIGA